MKEVRNSCAGDNRIPIPASAQTGRCGARVSRSGLAHNVTRSHPIETWTGTKSRQSWDDAGDAELRTLLRELKIAYYLGTEIARGW